MAFTKTNRHYQDVETGNRFTLFQEQDTHEFKLIYQGKGRPDETANGTEVNGFYICAHTSVNIKINNSKEVILPMGSFYNLKEGEKITHKKYPFSKRFTKA
jgi:hypothetical protein